MKRLLSKHLKAYLIDEYNTSKLNYITEKLCANLAIRSRSIHSVPTYQMQNERKRFINRNINAVNNIRKIAKNILFAPPKGTKRKII